MPATKVGKTSMWLALAFVLGFALNMPLVAVFGRSGMPEWLLPFMPSWGILLMATGVAAGVTALIAALKYRERSWAVLVALLPGGFATLFVLGEFLVPH